MPVPIACTANEFMCLVGLWSYKLTFSNVLRGCVDSYCYWCVLFINYS